MERAIFLKISFISVLVAISISLSSCSASGIEGKWALHENQYPMIRIQTNDKLVSELMEQQYSEIKRLRNKDIELMLNSKNRVKMKDNNLILGGAYTIMGDSLTMITVALNVDMDDDRYMRDDTTVYRMNTVDDRMLQLSLDVKDKNNYIWSNPTIWKRMGIDRPEDLEIISEELIYLYVKN